MIFTYQNRESSLNNKYNQKEKSNIIVAGYQAPSSNIPPNRSIYTTVRVGNTEPAKFSRVLVTPQRNPIKHYRRELTHDSYKTSSLKQIIKDFNAPGKTVVTNNTQNDTQNDNNLNNWIQNQNTPSKLWNSIALNNDGTKIVATVANNGKIYTSSDSGGTWVQTVAPSENWYNVACSDDGSKIAAVTLQGLTGKIYTSNDSGGSWNQASVASNGWKSIAMSANGNIVAAVAGNAQIYVSSDSGNTWNQYGPIKDWTGITMNKSGSKLAACAYGDEIYTSDNSGVNWSPTASGTKNWISIAMNSSGNLIVAGVQGEYIYISTDYGSTWTQTGAPLLLSNWYVSTSGDGSIIVAANLNAGIYVSYSSTNFNTWKQIVNSTNWNDIEISRNGNVAYATNAFLNQIWNTLPDYSSNKSCYFKDEIYPNNEKCSETFSYQDTDPYLWKTISCNRQDKLIQPAQTNMSQKYSPSMESLRYKRGQTYTRNLCNKPQTSIKNNGNMCSNNKDTSFTTNKHTIQNGTTSISDYKRQYGKKYNENGINIVNNSRCCNRITIKDLNYTKCNPEPKQKLKQTKNICVGLDVSSNININYVN